MDSSVSTRGNPFIGSRISLLSKSQMRYEGVLYQLDEDQSTLALAKVRSFGTEDRVPDRPVPPRDELFDYIVFRAMDIQDIKLSDAPKHPRTLPGGLSFDPAIVQYAVPSSSSDALPSGGSSLLNSTTLPRPPSNSVSQSAASYDPLEGIGHSKVGDLLSDLVRSRRTTPPSVRVEDGVQNSTTTPAQPSGDNQPRAVASIGNRGGRFPHGGRRGGIQALRPPLNFAPPAYMIRGAYRGPAGYNYYRRPIIPYRGQYLTWNRGGGYGNFRPNWNQGYRNYQQRRNQSQARKYTKDYDFERANTKFERIKAKTEKKEETTGGTATSEEKPESDEAKVNGDVENEVVDEVEKLTKAMEAANFYDKGKSFFDRISCEADAKREKKDKRREMAINQQTFGIKPATDYQRMPSMSYYYGRNNYVTYRGGRGGSYVGYGGSYGYGFRGGRGGYRGRYYERTTMSSRLMEAGN